MSGPVTDEQRVAVAAEVGDALAHGRMPEQRLVTEDATLRGTMFDTTLGVVTDQLGARWTALVAAFPSYAFHQREAHAVPGERVIVVGAAVSPGSSALTAAIYSFRGDRICGAECHRYPADAFRRVDLEWSGLGAGSA